jgi:hypothetical protein
MTVLIDTQVENSQQYTIDDWTTQMKLAASWGIQGFALNMAAGNPSTGGALNLAFAAAKNTGFEVRLLC